MSTVNVLTEITIARPREIVAAYAANPDNAPEWYANIHSAEWITDKIIAVGAQIAFKAKFMGKQLSYTYEIVEYEPGYKLVMRTAQGPFPMETTYMWEDVAGGNTRMKLRNVGNPKGFSMLMSPIMSWAMKMANNKDLALLRKILEK